MKRALVYLAFFVFWFVGFGVSQAEIPKGLVYTNSIGMKFVRIEPGTFLMGQPEELIPPDLRPLFRGRGLVDGLAPGDYDEKPRHKVTITKPFYISVTEVTNFQYELFEPGHKVFRGKVNLSREDDEAVIFVNWYDAQAFCSWLSNREGLSYRLPTESEWEYSCRAGTKTNFSFGDERSEAFKEKNRSRELLVGRRSPNKWGLYDMHGNVEEWCSDWYGPYPSSRQTDPVGYAEGDFRVNRGGSHSTEIYYLRSANRMAALPETRNELIGFRVVIGAKPKTGPLPQPRPPLNQRNVVQDRCDEVFRGPDPKEPYFKGPRKYVKIPTDAPANGPLFAHHNHDPAIAACPNGDLLAIWYTCMAEGARELGQAASRLICGETEWQPASPFWSVPDRNDHAPAMWFDGEKTIWHLTGTSTGLGRHKLAAVLRKSSDSGRTWSKPRLIMPEFNGNHQFSEPVIRLHDGTISTVVDGGPSLWMTKDEGITWYNPGGEIIGIHEGIVELRDGTIFALSRSNGSRSAMPASYSGDGGKTFTVKPTEFPSIGGQQRLALLRLREGPLFLASFANNGIEITDSSSTKRKVYGLFTAVSEDEGKTWPYKRLVTHDGPAKVIESTDGGAIVQSSRSSDYRGYMSVCQGFDGLIHLISSRNHYVFNLAWLKTCPPPEADEPVTVKHTVETFTGPDFDNENWLDYKGYTGGFNKRGQYTIDAPIHYNGLNRVTGSGSFEAFFDVKSIKYNPDRGTISEGLAMGFKDSFKRGNPPLTVHIKENGIVSDIGKAPKYTGKPPESAKVRFVYNEETLSCRVFYGLNGAKPVKELTAGGEGFYLESPLSESTAAMIMMSNGIVEVDRFEIKPLHP